MFLKVLIASLNLHWLLHYEKDPNLPSKFFYFKLPSVLRIEELNTKTGSISYKHTIISLIKTPVYNCSMDT